MIFRPLAVVCSLAVASLALAQKTPELMTTGPAATQPAVTQPTTQPKQLVYIERGELPIILSAPHGGRMKIPGSGVRTGKNILIKKGVKNTFTMAFDGNVDVIALTLADDIEKLTGKRPYVVVANFTRRNVDANRAPEQAYEDDAGEIVYNQYHDAIKAFRAEIIRTNKRGLIIDIHGHGREKDTIIRGTADWTSVRHLVEEFGKESVVGADGILGTLARDPAYKHLPAVDQLDEKEFPSLNGGFITRNYGSYQGGDFDSIQFELGSNIRKPENIPHFSETLAEGTVRFMNRYLLIPEPTTRPATTAPARDGQ